MTYPYKTVVVQVDSHGGTAARVEVAARIAAQASGYLLAVFQAEARAAANAELKDRVAAELEQFERIAAKAGVACEWLPAGAGDASALLGVGRCADLIVVGHRPPGHPEGSGARLAAAQLVLGVGRPVLIVPGSAAPATVAEHVVVAWNGTRESARAAADALPLLAHAKTVTVLSGVEAGGAGYTRPSAQGVMRLLAHHAIQAQVADLGETRFFVGDKILQYCAEQGADLLVMGAYGHSRASELVLGGVTQTVLGSMAIPVLMSH